MPTPDPAQASLCVGSTASENENVPRKPAGVPRLSSQVGLTIWLGPTISGLGWLHEQMSNQLRHFETLASGGDSANPVMPVDAVRAATESPVQRLVLACSSRIDYPSAAIEYLQTRAPHIPFALAVDSWWDGARRTGLTTSDHLTLPWYCWWDDWVTWLSGSQPDMLSPIVSPTDRIQPECQTRRGDCVADLHGPGANAAGNPLGLIVANCHSTARAWQENAHAIGHEALHMNAAEFQRGVGWRPTAAPTWFLLDDTAWDTHPDAETQVHSLVRSIHQRYPAALILAAFSQPAHPLVRVAQSAGCASMLPKPNSIHGLARAVEYLTTLPAR